MVLTVTGGLCPEPTPPLSTLFIPLVFGTLFSFFFWIPPSPSVLFFSFFSAVEFFLDVFFLTFPSVSQFPPFVWVWFLSWTVPLPVFLFFFFDWPPQRPFFFSFPLFSFLPFALVDWVMFEGCFVPVFPFFYIFALLWLFFLRFPLWCWEQDFSPLASLF